MSTGRNDPCPCGSGKKYKKCCLDRERHGQSLAEEGLRALQQAMADEKVGSLEEAQEFAGRFFQQRNQATLNDFLGLSPEEMHRLLNHPFDSPDLISFPTRLDKPPEAPIMTLFNLLVEAAGDEGLRATARGNLPRQFCRDAVLAVVGEEAYQERTRFSGINKEADYPDLTTTRLIARLAGLVLLRKQKFVITRKCRKILAEAGSGGIFPLLFKTYVQKYNWAYGDGFPDYFIIQQSFAFTLFMINRFGDACFPHEFYQQRFLRAFPQVVEESDHAGYSPPEKQAAACYTFRAIESFAGLFGLVSTDPAWFGRRHGPGFTVGKLPLLDEVVQFNFSERDWPSVEGHAASLAEDTSAEATRRLVDAPNRMYRFKITLQDTNPPIWRSILIAGNATFWDLHVAIQDAMGWTDSHLHEFEILYPDIPLIERIGIPSDEDFEEETLPGWEVEVASFFTPDNHKALYRYDFGDGWEHLVQLEKVLPRDQDTQLPTCLGGSRKCPPEDCGGTMGFRDFLVIIADFDHPEHRPMLKWAGGRFDPDEFDPSDIVFDDPRERLESLDEGW